MSHTGRTKFIGRIRIELPDALEYQSNDALDISDRAMLEEILFEALSEFFETKNIVVEVLN